jgi:two-component system cell cycle sensor histidine kinase/response regulator CckA
MGSNPNGARERMPDRPFPEELELLRMHLEQTAVSVYCIRNGRFAYVNERFAEALGYTREEILAFDSVTRIVPVDEHDAIRRMLDAGETAETRFVTTVRHANGSLLDVESHGFVVNCAGDRFLIGAAVDVTAHLASIRMIKGREEYFRALTENVSDIIAILDVDGVLCYISPSVERCLGYSAEELLGTVGFGCIHPDDRQRLTEALGELKRGDSFGPVESRMQHRNGSSRLLEVIGKNLLQHNQIHGLVINLRDITDRRRMEQEVAQLHRLTSLGRLSAQVAHEFNNVLMGIQPIVDVMRRAAAANPETLRQIDSIAASINRGKRITTDILRYGRPAQLTSKPVKADEILRKAVEEIGPMLCDDVKLDLVLSETPLVMADAAQLAQVFVNLALNARDAMPDGGTLTMKAGLAHAGEIGATQPFIHFQVSDTGTGIAAEDLPYIFEPLFSTKKTGTGLGLSVVYQIVTLHGGRISVESNPGNGTTFDLLIPALLEELTEKEEAAEITAAKCRRILLVEDEELIALGLRISLEAEGLEVDVARCGADAVPAIEAFQPDVIVLDLSLPDADGRDIYANISRRFGIPVVFSSGHAAEWEIDELLVPGRTAFLMKPYSTEKLLSTIETLMESREVAS